jgi:polyisoprenoid-binding protein YceI
MGGTLTLAGQTRPVRLQVEQTAPGHYRATTTVRQTDFGIKPYSAFLGSLKVADAVEIAVELDLSEAEDQEPTT